MSSGLRIVELDELRAVLAPEAVIAAVRAALVRHAAGEMAMPAPMQLVFDAPRGDCHVKAGHFRGDPRFVVKVASGFYGNPARGLAVNDGLVLVFDAATGAPQALIRDHGWLTSWRTAAAGALAAEAGAGPGISALGVIGTGHQARLQAEWTARRLGIGRVLVHGRSAERARELAGQLRTIGLDTAVAATVEALGEACRVIITCTPSTAPILPSAAIGPGTHIVALGADTPGKQELDPMLLHRAAVVMVDDRDQCADHGELSHAVRAGLMRADAATLLGEVLAGHRPGRLSPEDVTIADLTGTAAQDVAIAALALDLVEAR